MDPKRYDYYFKRAYAGKITPEEVEEVRAELQNPNRTGNPTTLINALVYDSLTMNARKDKEIRIHKDVISPFLQGPDPVVANTALEVLCTEYVSADEFTEELLNFMRGVPWDRSDLVKGTAMSIVGSYLNRFSDPELLRELIDIAENDAYLRSITKVYDVLHEALGHRGLPYGPREFDYVIDYEREGPELLREARERLAREEATNMGEAK